MFGTRFTGIINSRKQVFTPLGWGFCMSGNVRSVEI